MSNKEDDDSSMDEDEDMPGLESVSSSEVRVNPVTMVAPSLRLSYSAVGLVYPAWGSVRTCVYNTQIWYAHCYYVLIRVNVGTL